MKLKMNHKACTVLILSSVFASGLVSAQETLVGKIGNRPIVSGAHEVDRESMMASIEKELLARGASPLSLPSGSYPLTFGTLVPRVILTVDAERGTYQWESASSLLSLKPANLPGIVFKQMMAQMRLCVLNEPTAASYADILMSEFSHAGIDLIYPQPINVEIKLGYERPKLTLKIDSDSVEWGYIDSPSIDGNLVQEMFAIMQAHAGFRSKNGKSLVVFHGDDKLSTDKATSKTEVVLSVQTSELKTVSSETSAAAGKTGSDDTGGSAFSGDGSGGFASGQGLSPGNYDQNLRTEARVASSGQHTCRLFLDGTMKCIGRNDSGQAPDSFRFRKKAIQITVGRLHTCGLLIDGSIQCIGFRGYNRLGTDSIDDRDLTPDFYRFSRRAIQISAAEQSTCALLDDGTMECLGGEKVSNGQAPSHHAFSKPAIQISAGYLHTCALLSDGSIECVGSNLGGEAPTRQTYKKLVIRVSASEGHTCVLFDDGSADCQGISYHKPVKYHLQYDEPIIDISAGQYFTCVLLKSGAVKCVADDHRNSNFKGNADQIAQGGGGAVILQDGSVLEMGDNKQFKEVNSLSESSTL